MPKKKGRKSSKKKATKKPRTKKKTKKKTIKKKKQTKKTKQKKKIEAKKKVPKKVVKKVDTSKDNIYTTPIDRFYSIVKSKKKISVAAIARQLNIEKKTAMEWAKVLADHNLISIVNPVLGGPILKWKE